MEKNMEITIGFRVWGLRPGLRSRVGSRDCMEYFRSDIQFRVRVRVRIRNSKPESESVDWDWFCRYCPGS